MARAVERGILVVTLLLFFALALGAATAKSPTNDEPVHLTRGAALSQTGDLTLQFEHAPLSHRLIGSLMPTEPTLPAVSHLASRPTNDRPAIAHEFLWESDLDVGRALFLGRAPIIWSGALLGAALALWTKAVARRWPALAIVMLLYATSPNLLASAALATTDFVAAATFFAAVCAWWFYWQRPGRRRWALTGVLLGLALAAKLTGVLLLPVLFALAYVYPQRERWWRPGLVALGLLPVAGLVLWAVYAFQIGPWRGITVPAPAYWESWASVLTHVTGGHQAFFLGEISDSGWWSYFPVTLLLKSSLPVMLLYAASLVILLRARGWRIGAFLLLPVAAILAAAIYSRLNIGYRHVLPAVPFALVTIGASIPAIGSRRAGRWLVGAAAGWALAAALWIHPHHIAYFNELVGGPAQGYRYLGDSNLDWGQDLIGLADYSQTHDGDINISYGGVGEPQYYGINLPPLTGANGSGDPNFYPANPTAGRYAISAGHLQGLLPESDLFDWFRRREPDGNIGYSIFLYEVAASQPGEWIAQCASPVPLLGAAEAERLVNRSGARHLTFDCLSAWVFPDDGAPGWYILPHAGGSWWIDRAITGETRPVVVYRHGANEFGPDYDVYYWPGPVAPAALPGAPIAASLSASAPAELRGYSADGDEWFTWWRVAAQTAAPLSVQAHLYAGEGPPQVADGLGFTSDQWRPGDWFAQLHAFTAPGVALETGLYDFTTLERAGPVIRVPVP